MLVTGVFHAAPDGGQRYDAQCDVCHGDKGTGGVGIPLALPSLRNRSQKDSVLLPESTGYSGGLLVRPVPKAVKFTHVRAETGNAGGITLLIGEIGIAGCRCIAVLAGIHMACNRGDGKFAYVVTKTDIQTA